MAKDWTSLLQAATGYLRGKIADNETLVGEELNNDIIQFFVKILDLGSVSPNGNFDNETNGYQLVTALVNYIRTLGATEALQGVAEIATQTETNTGTDDSRIVTPAKLAGRIASETLRGIVELATQVEVDGGTTDNVVTAAKLAASTRGYPRGTFTLTEASRQSNTTYATPQFFGFLFDNTVQGKFNSNTGAGWLNDGSPQWRVEEHMSRIVMISGKIRYFTSSLPTNQKAADLINTSLPNFEHHCLGFVIDVITQEVLQTVHVIITTSGEVNVPDFASLPSVVTAEGIYISTSYTSQLTEP